MYIIIQTEYILWYTTQKYPYWFRAILGGFSKKKISEWDLDPLTHFHSILEFLEFSLHSPLVTMHIKVAELNTPSDGNGASKKKPSAIASV